MKPLLALLFMSIAQATPGFSLLGSSNPTVQLNTALLAQSQSWRVEFQISGTLPYTVQNDVIDDNGTGFHSDMLASSVLQVEDVRDITTGATCRLNLSANSLIRIQRSFGSLTFTVEHWNIDGTNYQTCSNPFTVQSWIFAGGAFLASLGPNVGFYRVFLTTVAMNSIRPTTADGSSYLECSLDSTLNCTGTAGTNLSIASGSVSYATTPGLVAYATVKTLNAPSWSSWISFRAGASNQLDGSGSLSMTPSSSTVTYFWQALSCPSSPIWSSRTVSQPLVNGLVFGTCTFQATVTDTAGNVSAASLAVGVVAADSNWVVIDSQPAFSRAVFGDQIAFGHNPWPYADWANLNAVNVVGSYIGGPTSGLTFADDWNNPLGTVTVSGTTMTFTGLNTQTTFCGGGSNWVQGVNPMPIVWYNDNVIAGRVGRLPVSPLATNGCPTTSTITIDTANYPFRSNATCTGGSPCTVGGSVSNWILYLGGQGTTSPGYYDGASMFHAFWRRSGLNQANIWADQLVCQQVTAPVVDQGFDTYVQARYVPTRQWAINLVYNPTSSCASAITLGVRQMATLFGYVFNPPGYPFSLPSQLVNGNQVNCTPYCLNDVRDRGSAAMDAAAWAYIETDPTNKALANTMLANSWTNMWGPQLQSDGHWDASSGAGIPGPIMTTTNGSTAATSAGLFTPTTCGTLKTLTGTVSFTNGGTTITGSGTHFTSAVGTDFLVLYGTYSGVYGKQVFGNNLTINSDTSITVPQIIRLDSGSGLSFQINTFPMMSIQPTDASGNPVTFKPDFNWYTCTYNNANSVTLDQPLKGNFNLSPGFSRFTSNSIGDNFSTTQGTEPFYQAFPAAALQLGSLVPADPANGLTTGVLTSMLNAAQGLYPYMSTTAWNSTQLGVDYATGFASCYPRYFDTFGCTSGYQSERMFGVESVRALAQGYIANPSSPALSFLTTYYGAEWGNPAYGSSPFSDGNFVQDCASAFTYGTLTKYAFQCFGLGSSASMPAALVGGVAPANLKTYPVGFSLSGISGAAKFRAILTAPNGAQVTITCTSSPCSLSGLDARQGDYLLQTQYLTSGNVVLASGDQVKFPVSP